MLLALLGALLGLVGEVLSLQPVGRGYPQSQHRDKSGSRMQVAPPNFTEYWVVRIEHPLLISKYSWSGMEIEKKMLARRVCHLTESAARTHAEALVKISGGVV